MTIIYVILGESLPEKQEEMTLLMYEKAYKQSKRDRDTQVYYLCLRTP
jgi:hypothetical protein